MPPPFKVHAANLLLPPLLLLLLLCAQAFQAILANLHMKAFLSLPAVLVVLAAFARDLQVRVSSLHFSLMSQQRARVSALPALQR